MEIKLTESKDRIYEYLTDSGEERVCENISEQYCKKVPGNFLLNALNGFSSKFAEQLASPELIIPWVLSVLGLPAFFSGLLVPVKNAGSLLPQLFVSAKIRAFERRKFFWVGAAVIQGLSMTLIAWAVGVLDGPVVGWIIVFSLFVFSISSGVASIAFKDVVGKTIPRGNRGKLLALRATGGGVLTILVGVFTYLFLTDIQEETTFIWLFVLAGGLWGLAALLFAGIQEAKGATEGGRTPIDELKDGLTLIREDDNFRRFLMVRGLLLAIPLVQPFLILFAQERIGVSVSELGFFVILTGVANSVSSPIWGKFADQSSKRLMLISGVFAALVCGLVLLFPWLPAPYQNIYTFSPVFFLIIMAYGGARLGRKTYLVDYAPEQERPLYVSVANTTIGVLVLASALLSSVSAIFGIEVMIVMLGVLMLMASGLAVRLKNV